MKIKVIASIPAEGQNHIHDFIGSEFETLSYKEFDSDVRKEMKELGEIAVRVDNSTYILNKEEYEIID